MRPSLRSGTRPTVGRGSVLVRGIRNNLILDVRSSPGLRCWVARRRAGVDGAVAAAEKGLGWAAVLAVGLRPGAQTGRRGDHRRASRVNGVNDLRVVDGLEINRRDPEMGMPELALDHDQRHAFVSHLDRVGVSELMLVPTSAQTPLSRLDR